MKTWSHLRLAIVIFALVLPGCFEIDVVWLPNATGFVYIRDKSLVLHDVNRNAERTIVDLDWLKYGEGRPAIDPDGKRVALVRHHVTSSSVEITVLVYGIDGELLQESPPLRLLFKPADDKTEEGTFCGFAEWSPNAEKIVFYAGGEDHKEEGLGIYDVRTQSIQRLPHLVVLSEIVVRGGSCCSPDGKGVLAIRVRGDDTQELVYVTWDGWVYEIRHQDVANGETGPEMFSLHVAPHWSGDSLILSAARTDQQTRIDVVNRQTSVVRANTELIGYARRNQVKNVLPLGDGFVLQTSDDAIQCAQPNEGATKTLVSAPTSSVKFILSPDGKHAVVKFKKGEVRHLLVVDSQGNVVSNRTR